MTHEARASGDVVIRVNNFGFSASVVGAFERARKLTKALLSAHQLQTWVHTRTTHRCCPRAQS